MSVCGYRYIFPQCNLSNLEIQYILSLNLVRLSHIS